MGAHDADRVLYRHVWHVVKRREREEEPDCPLLPSVASLLAKVKRTAHGQMRAWREGEDYVPVHLQ